jgi:hypothetical protein
MTQAFNLSQLANFVNSSGQLDGSTGVVNAVPSATTATNIASGTKGQVPVQSAAGTTTFIDSSFALKNRIINGAMVINQRALGTVTASGQYTLDRWVNASSGSGAFSIQQSSTAPAGFSNSMLMTVTTADSSLAASDNYVFRQKIEGYNCSDLAWGSASAKSATLSFWVQSSVTGTYGGAVTNSVTDRAYPFTYSIGSANTWTQISITISGDTTGTWPTDNSSCIQVRFSLGTGSDASFTANTWGANNAWSATGAGNFMATGSATFYITGVQLEKGSTATSFDYRPYGTELYLCYRYFYKSACFIGGDVVNPLTPMGFCYSITNVFLPVIYPVTMRATPTLSRTGCKLYNPLYGESSGVTSTATVSASNVSTVVQATVSSGLTAGASYWLAPATVATDNISYSAEL